MAEDKVAYELTPEFRGVDEETGARAFGGGSVALGSGGTLDIGELLEKGNGVIVVDPMKQDNKEGAPGPDELLDALDNFHALRRCAVPSKKAAASKGGD